MKKFFAMLITLTLVLSMNVTVFADQVTESGNSADAEVYAKYEQGDPAQTVYQVDIEWEGLSFTYYEGARVWDTDEHQYVSSDAGWDGTEGLIWVTNHSNAAITVSPEWNAFRGYESVEMLLTDQATGDSLGDMYLKSAADENEAVSGTIVVTPAGVLDETAINEVQIGVITIIINEADNDISGDDTTGEVPAEKEVIDVDTEEALMNALESASEREIIRLTSDIKLTEPAVVNGIAYLDLNGHIITSAETQTVIVNATKYLQVSDSVGKGMIENTYPDSGFIAVAIQNKGDLVVDANIKGSRYAIQNYPGGTATIRSGNVSAEAGDAITNNDANLYINGGTIEVPAHRSGIDNTGGKIIMNNGTIIAGVGITQQSGPDYAPNSYIEMNAGTIISTADSYYNYCIRMGIGSAKISEYAILDGDIFVMTNEDGQDIATLTLAENAEFTGEVVKGTKFIYDKPAQ